MQEFYEDYISKNYDIIEINDAQFKDLPKLNSAFMKNNIDDFNLHLKSLLDKMIYFSKCELKINQLNLEQSFFTAKEDLMELNQNIKLLIYAINEGTSLLDSFYTYENNIHTIFSNINNICAKMNITLKN
jgi:hypothetical protein